MIQAAMTAVSQGTLDLKGYDGSGRWWLGASVALAHAGYSRQSTESDLTSLWRELHKAGKV